MRRGRARRGLRALPPLQMPRRAHFAREQPQIGFLVGEKLFLLRVPRHFAVEANGDFAEVAERVRSDSFVDMANGISPAFDAIQEIAHVLETPDELHFKRLGVLVDQVFRL